MTYRCPACNRSFNEPGICPDDKTQLEEVNLPPQQSLPAMLAVSMVSGSEMDKAAISRRVSQYDHMIGETLEGRYLVQAKLGEGGMGVVFKVKHTVIERPLAIKVLKREVMRDDAAVKRFIQEARAASRIGHPNIVDVTDFGKTSDGVTYQVMELIEGMTLKQALKKAIKDGTPLPYDRCIRIGLQIARALAAAHAKGIVHRDLKPDNVFLTEREGRPDFVKIVDFGIAKVAPVDAAAPTGPRITKQGSVVGTPEYMAPEQASGRGDTDHRVDIYALGTILYEMIVGKTPHKGDSMIRTIAMQLMDDVIPPSKRRPDLQTPPELEAVIMRALEKKRDNRYQTMAEMQAALDDVAIRLAVPRPATDPATPSPAELAETAVGAPRRAKPATRQLHEPQFVEQPTQHSFDHLYAEDAHPEEEKRSRVPMILAGLLMLLVGAGGTILLIRKLQKETPVASVPAKASDAAIAELPVDAAGADAVVVVEVPIDAAVVATVKAKPDAGVAVVSAKGDITIEVMTRPADANVFVGVNYRGPSGVRLTERRGAKLKVECKTDRMKGSVDVVFDGSRTAVMCTASRDRFCVAGLKNPYDDCEEDPNAVP